MEDICEECMYPHPNFFCDECEGCELCCDCYEDDDDAERLFQC